MCASVGVFAMHRVASAGNTSSSVRPRKEKRLTYVLNDADDTKVSLTPFLIPNSKQLICLLPLIYE